MKRKCKRATACSDADAENSLCVRYAEVLRLRQMVDESGGSFRVRMRRCAPLVRSIGRLNPVSRNRQRSVTH